MTANTVHSFLVQTSTQELQNNCSSFGTNLH